MRKTVSISSLPRAAAVGVMAQLDLCFERSDASADSGTHGWSVVLNPGCGEAIDSATAKSDGLSLDGS